MKVALRSVLLGTLYLLLGVLFVLHHSLQKLLGILLGHLVGTRLRLLFLWILLVLLGLLLLLLLLLFLFVLLLFLLIILVLLLLILLWRILPEHIQRHKVVVARLVVVRVTAQAFAIGGNGLVVLFVKIKDKSYVMIYVREAFGVFLKASCLLEFVDCLLWIAPAKLCTRKIVVCYGVVGIAVNCLSVLYNGFLGFLLYINSVPHYTIAATYVVTVVLCTGRECKKT